MNGLRAELRALLDRTETARPTALRRSRDAGALYATDLPAAAGAEAAACFVSRTEDAGWLVRREGDWLLLDKAAVTPPEGWYAGPFGPEAACCRSLLERHPGGDSEAARDAIRALIKAGETGAEAIEAACRALHREWAARLRAGQPLPAVSPDYFGPYGFKREDEKGAGEHAADPHRTRGISD